MRISDWSSGVLFRSMAGQQAALGKFLAFSRVQESTADAAGAQYLSKAGISGRGSLAFFKKLQNLEFRYAVKQDDDQAYGRTHPMSGDRIQTLREVYVIDPAWNKPADPAIEKRFQRIKRSEEHTSELQSLMRISYDVICLKKKTYEHREQ